MRVLDEIKDCVINGRLRDNEAPIQQAKAEGFTAKEILTHSLIAGMEHIGQEWEKGEVFVPEVLIAARALNHALSLIEGDLIASGVEYKGTVVIGTVKGDLHDIGKNLVGLMLKGNGFKVIDIGVDCSAEKFIEAAEKEKADCIAMSSLLTTTMMYMETVVNELKNRNIRDKYKVICGGAPVTEDFAKKVGADFFAEDAVKAVELLKTVL